MYKECKKDKIKCQEKCNIKYDSCLLEAKKKAKYHIPIALKEYNIKMFEYSRLKAKRMNLEAQKRLFQKRCEKITSKCQQSKRIYSTLCKNKRFPKKLVSISISCKKLKNNYLNTCKNDDDCIKLHNINEEIKKIKNPLKPIMPTLDILISKFKAKAECTLNCGCIDIYDNCFDNCGGKVNYEKICVENCKDLNKSK